MCIRDRAECGCPTASANTSSNGDFDKFLKALAYTESTGSYTTNNQYANNGIAKGRYQVLSSKDIFDSYSPVYPPAKASSPDASAPSLPGPMQDAMVYLHLYKDYLAYDKDLLRLAAGWIYPIAADSPDDPQMDTDLGEQNNHNTPRSYAKIVLDRMNKSEAQKLDLNYLDAPEFEKYYKKLDGTKNTPYGTFPGGSSSSPSGGGSRAPATVPATSSDNQTVVVLDPGHAPNNHPGSRFNPAGILDINAVNTPEMEEVYKVAEKTKALLEPDYKVIITKKSVNDDPRLFERVKIINDNQADISLIIHYWAGASRPFGQWAEIYPQFVGGYRTKGENGSNSGRVTFDNQAVADKSLEYSKKMKTARQNNGENNVEIKNNSFGDPLYPDQSYGNLAVTQLLAEYPVVYNESGGPLNNNQQNSYAEGLAEGVKKAIGPNAHQGASTSTGCSSGSGDAAAIVEYALKYAWDTDGHGGEKADAKEAYWAPKEKYEPGLLYNDCGAFVSTVMQASGADTKYTSQPTGLYVDYVTSHPEKFEIIQSGDTGLLEPGDIFVKKTHTYLYVGEDAKNGNARSASLNTEVPQLSNTYFADPAGNKFTIARLK